MIRRRHWIGLVALPLWVACLGAPERQTGAPEAATVEEPAGRPRLVHLGAEAARNAGVEVAVAEPRDILETIEVPGQVTLDEDRTSRVGSFVEGVVVECCKSVGSHVREGDVLARVHSHATHEIVAEYLTAKAEVRGRGSELEYARQASDRAAKLHELKAGSLQTVQRAQTDVRAAQAALTSAEAALQRALAHLDYLGLDPGFIENPQAGEEPQIAVRAPSSGVVVERAVKLGDVVTPATPMYVLSDVSHVWVIAHIPEQLLGSLRPGMQVEVAARAYPGRTFPGRVTHVSNDLDADTKTVQARCSLANPAGALKTGMYATVRLRSDAARRALIVPGEAVEHIRDAAVVFVESGENTFEVRPVREGRRTGDGVEILEGLRPGERIAVAGAFVLKSEYSRAELTGGE